MARPALSASRATAILDLLTAFPERAFTISEIVQATGINLPSCYTVVNALDKRGFLARRADGKTYSLGPMLVAAGQATLQSHPLAAQAERTAELLFERTGVAVHLNAVVGDEILVIAVVAGDPADTSAGQRVPLIAPVGATYMAWAAPEVARDWIAKAGATDETQLQETMASLAFIRERGFEVALREPVATGFAALIAEMAKGHQPLDYRRQAANLISTQSARLIQPATVVATKLYDVASIVAPIFDQNAQVAFTLALRGFSGKLSGEDVLRNGAIIRDLCRETSLRVPD